MFEAIMVSIDINNNNISWYLDFGTTKHIRRDSSKIFELKTIKDSNVCSINMTSYLIIG